MHKKYRMITLENSQVTGPNFAVALQRQGEEGDSVSVVRKVMLVLSHGSVLVQLSISSPLRWEKRGGR